MVIRPARFNLYLLVAATAVLAASGCQSAKTKEEKQKATLRIHLETNPLPSGQSEVINVLRAAPILVSIERRPFLTEANIADARVAESADGFALVIQFDQQGQRLLEQYSAGNSRRRFAIRTQFRQSTNVYDRWIAAPMIAGRINNGMLAFTPDADEAEAAIIVRGWNNVAAENYPKKKSADKKKSEAAAEPK